MASKGQALYNQKDNCLNVIRPSEHIKRHINCSNINPEKMKVHYVEVDGDDIWVFVSAHSNSRPDRKVLYHFSSLSGGGSRTI
ncbi:hypothetical protein [uncultured Thiothrix sp.]|jgi:hypothetical protein|uniref:hypothetical protein n=1 Tax=uncultured Thiothrix sp. TaxID=223185 RepID=UPI002618F1AF|nr:hypothetical protein [uncultured Thiothrix sp.]HRJ94987.1 hypothetical protein [Candidatus Thiothrix moscowensis]